MTDYCSTAPWPTLCLAALSAALRAGDDDRVRSWIENHVDETDLGWNSLVISLAYLGSKMQGDLARRASAALGDSEIIFAPAQEPSLTQVECDAELIVSMTLNQDFPGVFGAMAAIRERGGEGDLIAALIVHATAMLQLEAHMAGGR